MKVTIVMRPGSTTALLDGQEVPLAGVELVPSVEAGTLPQAVLRLPADVDVNVEGVIYVEREPTEDQVRQVAADWVRGADPDVIRELVRPRMRTMADNEVRGTLEVLAELIGGDDGPPG